MATDNPPQDQEILALIEERKGLTPEEVITHFNEAGYSDAQIIGALQRVFDRGQLELSSGAKLILYHPPTKVAAA